MNDNNETTVNNEQKPAQYIEILSEYPTFEVMKGTVYKPEQKHPQNSYTLFINDVDVSGLSLRDLQYVHKMLEHYIREELKYQNYDE